MGKLVEKEDIDVFSNEKSYYYEYSFDDFVEYGDIDSILDVLPSDSKYANFALTNYEESPNGYMNYFKSIEEFVNYYRQYPNLDDVDKFSFDSFLQTGKVSFCFDMASNEAVALTGKNKCNLENFFDTINESVLRNKKKQL